MRLFLGLRPPPAVAASIAERTHAVLQGAIEKVYSATDLHLTLVFLGEVAPKREAELDVKFSRAFADAESFPLEIGGTGAFGNPGQEWALWAGIQPDVASGARLQDLVARSRRLAEDCGIVLPVADLERPFAPHLTLARPRTRERAPVEFRSLRFGVGWTAEAVHLFESVGGSKPGPRYPVRATQLLRERSAKPAS